MPLSSDFHLLWTDDILSYVKEYSIFGVAFLVQVGFTSGLTMADNCTIQVIRNIMLRTSL